MGDRSTDKLLNALYVAFAPAPLIQKAKAGEYHDFKSRSASPIADLVRDCRKAGLEKIAKQAINGDFDATKKESDAWVKSADGQGTIGRLLSGD